MNEHSQFSCPDWFQLKFHNKAENNTIIFDWKKVYGINYFNGEKSEMKLDVYDETLVLLIT